MPTAWRQLGVRPRWKQLYCTYLVNAGAAGSALPASSIGSTMWPISAQPLSVPWFYVLAACNLGGAAGWPNTDTDRYVTVLMLTHDSPVVRTIDENE
jgi:hypothetical protein